MVTASVSGVFFLTGPPRHAGRRSSKKWANITARSYCCNRMISLDGHPHALFAA